jgi:ADP-dependent phosphofructokinase/glucokinase
MTNKSNDGIESFCSLCADVKNMRGELRVRNTDHKEGSRMAVDQVS